MKKIMALMLAAVMFLALAACDGSGSDKKRKDNGNSSSETALQGDPTPIDHGWIRLDMPAGFVDLTSSDYIHIANESNTDQFITIAYDFMSASMDALVNDQVSQSGGSLGEPFEAAGYQWSVISLVSNGTDARRFFTQINDMFYLRINTFDLTEKDEVVEQVMKSLVIDVSKM